MDPFTGTYHDSALCGHSTSTADKFKGVKPEKEKDEYLFNFNTTKRILQQNSRSGNMSAVVVAFYAAVALECVDYTIRPMG